MEETGVERISFSYPREWKESLKQIAKEDDRKLSSWIQVLLKKELEKRGMLPVGSDEAIKPKRVLRKKQ